MIGSEPLAVQLGHAAGRILGDALRHAEDHPALLAGADRDGHRTVRAVHPADLVWVERRMGQ